MTDEELYSRWLAGDAEAMNVLCAKYRRYAEGAALRYGRVEDKEDLVQNAWLALLETRNKPPDVPFDKHLGLQVKWAALAMYKQKVWGKRRRLVAMDEVDLEKKAPRVYQEGREITEGDVRRMKQSILAALSTPKLRRTVKAILFEGVPTTRHALDEGVTINAIHLRLLHARKLVYKRLRVVLPGIERRSAKIKIKRRIT